MFTHTSRWIGTVAGLALLVGAGAACSSDDSEPTRTGETTPSGEHCVADLPDGDCLTEEEGERGVDRWAAWVDCVQERDGDPNDTCPTPGEMP